MGDLIDALELYGEGDQAKCVPLDKLTVERSLYWFSLAEFCSNNDDFEDHLENVLPDLSIFCDYVTR